MLSQAIDHLCFSLILGLPHLAMPIMPVGVEEITILIVPLKYLFGIDALSHHATAQRYGTLLS
jgi:hypothetical protein